MSGLELEPYQSVKVLSHPTRREVVEIHVRMISHLRPQVQVPEEVVSLSTLQLLGDLLIEKTLERVVDLVLDFLPDWC